MAIRTERIYESRRRRAGLRVLVDRLWPRGLARQDVVVDLWLKEVAPSTELRKWFAHDPERWEEFKRRYFRELDRQPAAIERLLEAAEQRSVVLLYGARDKEHNQAAALKEYLEQVAVLR